MHKQAIKALENKVNDLHEQELIYCDHSDTEEVTFALVQAIGNESDEDMIRSDLRKEMRRLRRQGWVHGDHKNQTAKELADVVIDEMRKL